MLYRVPQRQQSRGLVSCYTIQLEINSIKLATIMARADADAEAESGRRVPACDLGQDEGGWCVDYLPRREKRPHRGQSPGVRLIIPIEIRQTLVWSIYKADCAGLSHCVPRLCGLHLPPRGTRASIALPAN